MNETVITSSVLIVVIIGIRFLFAGKISRRLQYALWGLVLLRLCLPFTLFSSPISLMNAVNLDDILYETGYSQAPADIYQENVQEQSEVENVIQTSGSGDTALDLNEYQSASMTLADVLKIVWIIGSIAVGLWFVGANFRFYLRLRNSRKMYDKAGCKLPVYLTDGIASPCLFGLFRTAIYLTPKATESDETLRHVLAHELCHYRHCDHIWSALRGLCLAAYWWNPLIWTAAILSRTDSELACDEAVIKWIGENNRLFYGRTLIDMIAVKKAPAGLMCTATTMSSGKRGIKERLNMIIKNPKAYIPAMVAVLLITAVCVGCTFTGAQDNDYQTEGNEVVSNYAQELYDCRNPYIGDTPANGALLTAMGLPKKLDSYTLELETEKEPYILRLIFTNEVTNAAALNSAMNANAMLLLALIDNVSEIQWQYTYSDQAVGGSGKFTGSLTIDDATAALNGADIKSYGMSAAKVQVLLDWLENVTVSIDRTNLEACISDVILSTNANQYHNGDFAAEAHTVFKFVESGNTTTVYAMALYMKFGYAGGRFSETGGSHMPVAITFEKNDAGEYELKEYWTPQDGSHYAPSIKEKFPSDTYEDALDTQKYIVAHTQSCYAQAIAYGKVATGANISILLETICSSPATASNPGAYIDEHPIEYRKLLYYGDYTLRYCFARFEEGGQTDLNGHIMAAACRNILGDIEDIDLLANTGQEWYDAFKKSAEQLRNKNGDDYMKKHMPGSYLLLQMLDVAKE